MIVENLVSTKLPIYLKPHEVRALLKAPTDLRDRIILRLLYFCALRVSEAVALRLEDVDFLDRSIKVCHAITPHGMPKGRKERLVPVDSETLRLIVAYAGSKTAGRLYHLSIRQIQRIIKDYARLAGIQGWERITPHKLRHSFAVHWVKRGGDLERLRRILGHSRLETTQIYLQFRFEDVKNEYDRITIGEIHSSDDQETVDAIIDLKKRLDKLVAKLGTSA